MSVSLSTSLSGKKEPKRANRWILKFDKIPMKLSQVVGGSAPASDGQNPEESLAIDLREAARPTLALNPGTVSRLNEQWKFAQNPTWEPITVTYYDYDKGKFSATQILWRWTQTIYDVLNGTMGYAAMYKTDASLILLGPGQTVSTSQKDATTSIDIIEAWDLFGCWPGNFTPGTLGYESMDFLQVSIEINFDYANLHTASDYGGAFWSAGNI